ncbi:MAG TPA: agmatinase [Thermoanaerobaculales bacterium]|nr:agmatinase [Thermoanaerobaculales bacterium]HPA80035.1 agmatinase [Thermoanaerobaculales bacterium]HQL28941.1 agmatinase [Thermoanaerobaculales bacterium]HQN97259.1 agmatinase [Thermoanaerobaculales bacterium]
MDLIRPNFLNLDEEASDADRSGVLILPLPLDITASWKRGTGDGPAAILAASHHIEFYDEELDAIPWELVGGIATQPTPELPVDPAAAAQVIFEIASSLVRPDRLLLSLGGEHAVTAPLVRAHQALWPALSVVQIDAHADLRDSYLGSPHNHACPMRRIVEDGVFLTGIGIRSLDEPERRFIRGERSRLHLGHQVAGRLAEVAEEIIAGVPPGPVYLTIDLDGFDPSVVPAVGTPVPGGLGWAETLAFVRRLCESRPVVGADVVELAPREGLHYADAAAARLVHKIIGYVAVARRGGDVGFRV